MSINDAAHESSAGATWAPIPPGSHFGVANLPYGVAVIDDRPMVVTRVGDGVLPVAYALAGRPEWAELFADGNLDRFLATGPETWAGVRAELCRFFLDKGQARELIPVSGLRLVLPFTVGDYVDFYASLDHATNLGRLFRPDSEPLLPNWRRLPVGYHGRSRGIVVSGTRVLRPAGLVRSGDEVVRRPCAQLDYEVEVGFVVGGSNGGRPVGVDDADQHVFGVVLVNDWSARDIQAFEYQPLGPMLGKSFATSVSPWVVPLEAVKPYLLQQPRQEPEPDSVLRGTRPWGLDLALDVSVNGTTVGATNAAGLYWTFAQQLAHLTSNGSLIGPGDFYATGTVSGPGETERGSLIEAAWRGANPVKLADGSERSWLLDGDEVLIRGRFGPEGSGVGLGEVVGRVVPDEVDASMFLP